ncbi:hypothetical protein Cgig2_004674 [Carnegiea gigantea]|uniref:C2H2-type domain-containing protein n=1 Tax=Carnegiea gigantea TaxID=171969 RepID=A0A9Q1Q9R6_9CARY|nr:hypothetical protein Cgig2_004674 [Carnegiea gigantea]
MRNYNTTEEEQEEEEEGDSWELARAFAEDAIRSTTWPPRSCTCSFCRREFRSAQALGGHMNVHRRDRVRLQQAQFNQDRPAGTSLMSASADDSLLNCCRGHGGCGGDGTVGLCPFYNNYQLGNYDYSDYTTEMSNNGSKDIKLINIEEEAINEELDLELRLGHIPA